jgi:DNA-binding transcriptional LysR family regulator
MEVHTRRLRHFITLAEELHFTRAADRLHVSQQGLSRSIRELEQLVGAPLVHRTTRTVVLTEAGQAFLQALPDALAALDSAADAARRAHAKVSGVLRLGFTVASALELTPPITSEFQRRYPAVTLELEAFYWGDPSCGLRSDETDVAFVRLPIDCPDLHTAALFVEPRAIGVARSHRLAGTGPVTVRELAGEAIMAPRTDDEAWAAFWTLRDTELEEAELPRIDRAVTSMEEELEAVSAGLAITICPLSISRFFPRPTIDFRPIADVTGSTLAVGWRGAGTPLVHAFRAVATQIREQEEDIVARIETQSARPPDVLGESHDH